MAYYADLYLTPDADPAPPPPGESERQLGNAADIVPLGWLALFDPADLVELRDDDDRALLSPITRVTAARERLARRSALLCDVFPLIDADDHLDRLDGLLARAGAEGHVQVWTGGLVAPWLPEERADLESMLRGLDGRDLGVWDRLLASVDANRIDIGDGKLHTDFGGVDLGKCVGWLSGGPAPTFERLRWPDVSAADERFRALDAGRGRLFADVRRFILEIAPEAAHAREEAEQLLEASYDHDDDWLQRTARASPPALRAALYAARLGDFADVSGEPDPILRRALVASALCRSVRAGDPCVDAALRDPDARVRALLAFTYRGQGDEEQHEDEDGNTLPAPVDDVWRALVTDDDERVRTALLWNPRAPLRPPPSDPSPLVRAHHRDTTKRELRALVKSEDVHVLEGVFYHPHTQPSFQVQICKALEIG